MRGGSVPSAGAGDTRRSGDTGGRETGDRKANVVPVDPRTAMVTDGFGELGDNDEDRSSQADMAHMLGEMDI